MSENSFIRGIIKGTLISVISTLFLLVFMAILMVIFDFSPKVYNFAYEFIAAISLVFGSIVAAKINKRTNREGCVSGLFVGVVLFLFMILLGSIINGKLYLSSVEGYKLLIILSLSTISGILGVNMQ